MKYNAVPVLTNEESALLEEQLLGNDGARIWGAMSAVGLNLGFSVLDDFLEFGDIPEDIKILVLAGVGHNAGDAILSAAAIKGVCPQAEIKVFFAFGEDKLKPLVKKALTQLGHYEVLSIDEVMEECFDISLDGILGMSFHPPVEEPLFSVIKRINQHPGIHLRASVDVPSGFILRADFSYATGTPKAELFANENQDVVGRIRFIDIGFFEKGYEGQHSLGEFLLEEKILDPLKKLRPSFCDKRSYGHLYILSGSKNYPGALLMSVKSAVMSGVGLVTVFAPESLVPAFAAQVPEAIWVPFPETKEGSLALAGKNLLLERLSQGSALLMGPGLGENSESLQLVSEIAEICKLPMVIDASALVPSVFSKVKNRSRQFGQVIATPHLGEFKRIAGEKSLIEWNLETGVITLLKGSISQIVDQGVIYNSTFGGPVLARGGSGDILSGLIGGLLAQCPQDPFGALAKAVVWHGIAADNLARNRGQVAVRTTDICAYLSQSLRL